MNELGEHKFANSTIQAEDSDSKFHPGPFDFSFTGGLDSAKRFQECPGVFARCGKQERFSRTYLATHFPKTWLRSRERFCIIESGGQETGARDEGERGRKRSGDDSVCVPACTGCGMQSARNNGFIRSARSSWQPWLYRFECPFFYTPT